MEKIFKKVTEYYTDPKEDEPEEVTNTFTDDEKSEIRADEIKPEMKVDGIEFNLCSVKAKEAVKQIYDKFVDQQIKVLKKGHEAQAVDLLLGAPTVSDGDGKVKKIKGTLAYAGVSLNNRLYLPEQLSKGDGMTVPLILNHASVSGAEAELPMLPDIFKIGLMNGEEMKIGEVSMTWKADENTLYYEGEISDEFFISEVDAGKMTVSLGMYYDADSPTICDRECYTVIKGAEFHEVSLVYHPGFPIATIEAVESLLKVKALESISVSKKIELYAREVIQGVLSEEGGTIEDSDLLDNLIKSGHNKKISREVVSRLAQEENATEPEIKEWMIANEGLDATIRYGITKKRANEILNDDPKKHEFLSEGEDYDECQVCGDKKSAHEVIPNSIPEATMYARDILEELSNEGNEITAGDLMDNLIGHGYSEDVAREVVHVVSNEAVGPHSRDYSYVINEPTSSPESTGSNATQYSKPPSTRQFNSRVNQNLEPDSLKSNEEVSVSGPPSSTSMIANKKQEEAFNQPEGKVVTPIRGSKS